MASVIRSAKLGDGEFAISSTDDSLEVVSSDQQQEKYSIEGFEELEDNNHSDIISDEMKRKILEYSRELEVADRKIKTLEEHSDSLQMEIHRAKDDAHSKGFEEGIAEGRKAAQTELENRLMVFDRLTESYKNEMSKILSLSEDALIETVFVATGKIIGMQVRTIDGCQELVKEAMRKLDHSERLLVRVAPDDFDYLNQVLQTETGVANQLETRIIADEHVSVGGCILEHDGGILDARLEIQLQRLRETLISIREQRKLNVDPG
ncbi:MAG: FliH/SctL family protein [Candidatus Sedimenticola sp. (ex Thyasira tokunagai)]